MHEESSSNSPSPPAPSRLAPGGCLPSSLSPVIARRRTGNCLRHNHLFAALPECSVVGLFDRQGVARDIGQDAHTNVEGGVARQVESVRAAAEMDQQVRQRLVRMIAHIRTVNIPGPPVGVSHSPRVSATPSMMAAAKAVVLAPARGLSRGGPGSSASFIPVLHPRWDKLCADNSVRTQVSRGGHGYRPLPWAKGLEVEWLHSRRNYTVDAK